LPVQDLKYAKEAPNSSFLTPVDDTDIVSSGKDLKAKYFKQHIEFCKLKEQLDQS
jgi:hypothetical protein